MSVAIALVCEGPDDGRIVPELAGRLACEAVDWLRDQPDLLTWQGYEPGTRFTTWASLKRLAVMANQPKAPPNFGSGLPKREDAPDALRILRMLDGLPTDRRPVAVILQRDDDRTHTARRLALELARDGGPWAFPVVVGVAHPGIEAWVLAGFLPDEREAPTHAEVCQHLGFDPCREGHRLSPNHDDPTKRAKAVRERLTGNHWSRERRCLQDTDWPTLEANGRDSGLADFMAEVRQRLIPRAFGTPPP